MHTLATAFPNTPKRLRAAPRPGRRRAGSRLTVAAALVLAASIAAPAAHAGDGAPKIRGVWKVTRHGVNCSTGQEMSTFPALMTFGRDGAVYGSAVAPGSTPAQGLTEHGVWSKAAGPGEYRFRFVSYSYDESGAFAGSTEATGELKLEPGSTSFSYSASLAFFDAAGGPLFTGCGRATGERFE